MTRYIETFFRHKVLLLTPLVLTLLVSVWYVAQQPKSYTTSTTLWVDNQLPGPAFNEPGGANSGPPAPQAQTLLTQLLSTRDFVDKAAGRQPLAGYVASLGNKSSQEKVATDLGTSATAVAIGPQILQIWMKSGDPNLAKDQLQAIVDEYFAYTTTLRGAREQAVVDYYQPRLEAATKTLQDAQAAQIAYLETHPAAGNIGSVDPTYAALTSAVATAQGQFADVQKSFNQANQSLTSQQASVSSHVIDQPSTPSAESKKKSAIFAGAAGLFFGMLVGLLGLIGLTAADTAARRREDVEMSADGLQVVATISEFPRERVTARESSSSKEASS